MVLATERAKGNENGEEEIRDREKIKRDNKEKRYKGSFIHSVSLDQIEIINATCIVDQNGTIVSFEPFMENPSESHNENDQQQNKHEQEGNENEWQDYFWIPGFIDCHTHAPQYENLGLGLDQPLLEWLENTTIPVEMTFDSQSLPINHSLQHLQQYKLIKSKYDSMIKRYLISGTTTACYFGSIHLESTKILSNLLEQNGQRAFVGKTCMDQHSFHGYLDSNTESSIESTRKFIEYCKGIIDENGKRQEFNKRNEMNSIDSFDENDKRIDNDLKSKINIITPVITPRFAITCSMDLMKELAQLSNEYNCPIQSHLCENEKEIEFVKEIYPNVENYTMVYDEAGLLTDRTIMAHCIHLTDKEIEILKQRKVAIAHCPVSNFALNSGIMNMRRLLNAGIENIGLGSDISGGYSICILEVMRQAIIASKAIHFQDNSLLPLSCKEAFYLATLGGAIALGSSHLIGNFMIGKKFDALLIKKDKLFPGEQLNLMQEFERFIYCGDDRRIAKIFVNGKQISL